MTDAPPEVLEVGLSAADLAAEIVLWDRLLWRFARRFARKDDALCDDLHAAARLGMVMAGRTYDPARGLKFITFASWHVRAQVRHEYGRQRRRGFRGGGAEAVRTESLAEALPAAPPPAPADGGPFGGLTAAVAALPPREAQVLRWRYLDGLKPGEIAARLGVTRTRVTQILALARRRVRRAVECDVPGPAAGAGPA